jgi:hypothetical protein
VFNVSFYTLDLRSKGGICHSFCDIMGAGLDGDALLHSKPTPANADLGHHSVQR